MESYMFQTYQQVPERVIRAIGEDIKKNMALRLRYLEADKLMDVMVDFDLAIDQVASEKSPSVDGYRLTDLQVGNIAEQIRIGKPIDAIKEFRMATSAQLREARDFIYKFTQGRSSEEAFIMFTNAFSGQEEYGRRN